MTGTLRASLVDVLGSYWRSRPLAAPAASDPTVAVQHTTSAMIATPVTSGRGRRYRCRVTFDETLAAMHEVPGERSTFD
jgi:hypothetical protein